MSRVSSCIGKTQKWTIFGGFSAHWKKNTGSLCCGVRSKMDHSILSICTTCDAAFRQNYSTTLITGPTTHIVGDQTSDVFWRLSSSSVTLHGGPLSFRPVRATPCSYYCYSALIHFLISVPYKLFACLFVYLTSFFSFFLPYFFPYTFFLTHLLPDLSTPSRYCWNHCIDFHQIQQNVGDHQVLFLGGPKTYDKSNMANGAILENKIKNVTSF